LEDRKKFQGGGANFFVARMVNPSLRSAVSTSARAEATVPPAIAARKPALSIFRTTLLIDQSV
jgi:hypothetical protein